MRQKGQVQIILIGVLVIATLVGGAYYFTKPTSQICIQMQAWAKSSLGGQCQAFPTPCDVPRFWAKCTPPVTSQTPQPSPLPTNNIGFPNSSPSEIVVPHLADDKSIPIKNIKIEIVILQPKDASSLLLQNWQSLAEDMFKEAITFWKRELNNESNLTLQIYQQIISGELAAAQYDFNTAANEVVQKLGAKGELTAYTSRQTNEYLILYVYVLSDSQHYYQPNAAGNHYSNVAGNNYSQIGIVVAQITFNLINFPNRAQVIGGGVPAEVAHETGHALGLQHSNDDSNIRLKYLVGGLWKSDCDLMVGHGIKQNVKFIKGGTLSDIYCIIPEQKQLFFNQ